MPSFSHSLVRKSADSGLKTFAGIRDVQLPIERWIITHITISRRIVSVWVRNICLMIKLILTPHPDSFNSFVELKYCFFWGKDRVYSLAKWIGRSFYKKILNIVWNPYIYRFINREHFALILKRTFQKWLSGNVFDFFLL